MKELEDVLQLLPFSPYIHGHFDIDKKIYICTAVIKNPLISNQELAKIQNLADIQKLQKESNIYI